MLIRVKTKLEGLKLFHVLYQLHREHTAVFYTVHPRGKRKYSSVTVGSSRNKNELQLETVVYLKRWSGVRYLVHMINFHRAGKNQSGSQLLNNPAPGLHLCTRLCC